MTLLLVFASGTSKSMWAVRSSGFFFSPFSVHFILPPAPTPPRLFKWLFRDLPSFENLLIHPGALSLWGRGGEGWGAGGDPAKS